MRNVIARAGVGETAVGFWAAMAALGASVAKALSTNRRASSKRA